MTNDYTTIVDIITRHVMFPVMFRLDVFRGVGVLWIPLHGDFRLLPPHRHQSSTTTEGLPNRPRNPGV